MKLTIDQTASASEAYFDRLLELGERASDKAVEKVMDEVNDWLDRGLQFFLLSAPIQKIYKSVDV